MKKLQKPEAPLQVLFQNKKHLVHTIVALLLFIILAIIACYSLQTHFARKSYETHILQIANLNEDTVFSLQNIFIFHSATATTNTDTNSLWSLDIHQYSDIALFIDNHAENGYTTKNTISSLYLDNFSIQGSSVGTPSLSYKDVQTFGKYVDLEETAITDTLAYTITNGNTVDSTIAQMDIACKSPITLGFMNKKVKEGYTVVDTSSALQYNGSLLKTAMIPLQSIAPTIAFDIHIENQLGETYMLSVQFPLSMEDAQSSIYDGTFQQDIVYNKAFFRVS